MIWVTCGFLWLLVGLKIPLLLFGANSGRLPTWVYGTVAGLELGISALFVLGRLFRPL